MGQRSQIYVRYPVKGGYGLIANYYQWNYGERMISRCRHTLEYIRDGVLEFLDFYFGYYREKFRRYIDVNFDMKDIVMSSDIVKEYEEYGYGDFNAYVFFNQDNNDGSLFIDISQDGVKYAFLDHDGVVMNAEQYMDWDTFEWKEDWRGQDYAEICRKNIEAIDKLAVLMTEDEVYEMMGCKYENEPEKSKVGVAEL